MSAVVIDPGEYEVAAYVGLRRGLTAALGGLRGRDGSARPHFGTHVDGAVAEYVVAKALGMPWPRTPFVVDRSSGDLAYPDGTPIEVRHTHRANGGLPIHEADPDGHFAILVRGRFPRFEVVGGCYCRFGKDPAYWRPDIPEPCYIVPAEHLRGVWG